MKLHGMTAAAGAMVLILCAGASARAAVIDFNLPSGQGNLGSSYSQDGFTFTNSYPSASSYRNWVAYGHPSYNADDTADIFQNDGYTTNTITQDSGPGFSFQSIALAPVYNDGSGGSVLFTFDYVGGGSSSQLVTMTPGVLGLQTFNFNQSNLADVKFVATTTSGGFLQFDEVGVNAAVAGIPEPGAWATIILGLFATGALLRSRPQSRAAIA